eukprot:5517431-Ditylum_brightwellii.AAC.1
MTLLAASAPTSCYNITKNTTTKVTKIIKKEDCRKLYIHQRQDFYNNTMSGLKPGLKILTLEGAEK